MKKRMMGEGGGGADRKEDGERLTSGAHLKSIKQRQDTPLPLPIRVSHDHRRHHTIYLVSISIEF